MPVPVQPSYAVGHRPNVGPGHPVDATPSSGRTATAGVEIQFGAAIQRSGDKQVIPLAPGGAFAGIAGIGRSSRDVGAYGQFDNVRIEDRGRWWGLADKAIPSGAALNWNSATGRWTDQTASGAIVATPGVEADAAANGHGHEIPVKLRRPRA